MAAIELFSDSLEPVNIAAHVLVAIVALLHVYFFILESFLWATPYGEKSFQRTHEQQLATLPLAQNQGLYNGFLAAGLAWSFFADATIAFQLRLFFLICIVVAGIVGAMTASKKILYVQAIPALIALALVFVSHSS
jgi:putative membrane protein